METETRSEVKNKSVQDESFRDSIATIDKKGKRVWIYPHEPSGKFTNRRIALSYFYLLLFFGLPFIKVNGDPLFLFNVIERKFILFGQIFWPQDFFIFGLGMLIFILFIVIFTVTFGRIFCGWACPQTIFMEMVFRRVEYWIEGNANQQKALNNGPWNTEKYIKKSAKNIVFFFISFVIANTFLSYLLGVDSVFQMISEPVQKNSGTLIALLIFTGVFYGVYTRFREQVCLIVCPYGRMQGVMLDKHSIVVAYDYVRGEPRHKPKETELKGDCIDCHQCVKVCPTGIDIRNGTQLECVNCTACIDACDAIMRGIHKPEGLIRYASEEGIKNNEPLKITNRIKAYSTVLIALIALEAFLLISRTDIDATVMRSGGQLYQEQPDGRISNLYTIKVINKTRENIPVDLKVESHDAEIKMVGNPVYLKSGGIAQGNFFIVLKRDLLSERKTKMKIALISNGKKIKTVKTNFFCPIKMK